MSKEAPAPPPWKFLCYKTVGGSEVLQKWFWGLDEEVRDEFADRLSYLQNVANHLWIRPRFDRLGDTDGLSEIRVKKGDVTYRIYGYFGIERNEFTFLVGTDKKTNDQPKEKKLAAKRKREIEESNDRSLVHEFSVERKPASADSTKQTGAHGANGVSFGKNYRLPN